MTIVYKCRHCGHKIGKIEERFVDTSLLGWENLSLEDRKNMIHYQSNGDVQINIICESCEEALGRYPQYHELDHFIQ